MSTQLTVPTLLVDEGKVRTAIQRMVAKADQNNVVFRPHFKTHQSRKVGEWFLEAGVAKITVSSVKMARYFADAGWNDITIAFPFNVHETEALNAFPEETTIQILIADAYAVAPILHRLKRPVNALIKIDTGYGRTGFQPDDDASIQRILAVLKPSFFISFAGFLAHAGHSYKAGGDKALIKSINTETCNQMAALGAQYRNQFPDLVLSIGDTPCCSVADSFPGVTEIRPGNFVFYDLAQSDIGSCSLDEVAVCMAVPVVAKHADRKRIITYGGGVHFSKDVIETGAEKRWGKVVEWTEQGWEPGDSGWKIISFSQEHGVLEADDYETFEEYAVGDWVPILPVHSCLTADAMKSYQTLDGVTLDHCEGS